MRNISRILNRFNTIKNEYIYVQSSMKKVHQVTKQLNHDKCVGEE